MPEQPGEKEVTPLTSSEGSPSVSKLKRGAGADFRGRDDDSDNEEGGGEPKEGFQRADATELQKRR